MVNISNKNLVSFLLKNSGYDFNDWGTVDEFPIRKVKYLGLKYDSDLVQSFIYGFISQNIDLLVSGDQYYGKYTQPTLETYKLEGEERYSQTISDLYYMYRKSYSLDYLQVIRDAEIPPFKIYTDYGVEMVLLLRNYQYKFHKIQVRASYAANFTLEKQFHIVQIAEVKIAMAI